MIFDYIQFYLLSCALSPRTQAKVSVQTFPKETSGNCDTMSICKGTVIGCYVPFGQLPATLHPRDDCISSARMTSLNACVVAQINQSHTLA